MQGEEASADVEATASYPEDLAKIINEGGYTKQQLFTVDETVSCWKKMPSRTFVAREEKSMAGFKASKDRLTFFLVAKAASGLNLKPVLLDHSESPTVLKNYTKSTMPVLFKWNNTSRNTTHLFKTWFTEYFKSNIAQKKDSFQNITAL